MGKARLMRVVDPGERVLIVFDGLAWFVRRVCVIEENLDRGEKVYHCDEALGGPYKTLDEACSRLKQATST